MKKSGESLGEFWDNWEKETEELKKSNREMVEKIKQEVKDRHNNLKLKEDNKNEV